MSESTRKQVLILGNGVSRLLLVREIREWAGEIWGCNLAYQEPEIGPRLTRLTGHATVMEEAAEYQRAHAELTFEIWGGHAGQAVGRVFTCPGEFRHDSGTTLVAQALHEGLDVICAGFDLGGPDIHSPRLWEQRKSTWVKRWRQILEHYGWDHVTFWGYDHMPYLKSGSSTVRYCNKYAAGIPHIPGDEYRQLFAAQYEKETGKQAGHYQGYDDEQMVRFSFQGDGSTYVTRLRLSVAKILQARGDGVMLPPEVRIKERTIEEEKVVKVRFKKNGYETQMKESVAGILVGRGVVELLEGALPGPKPEEAPHEELAQAAEIPEPPPTPPAPKLAITDEPELALAAAQAEAAPPVQPRRQYTRRSRR